MRLFIGFHLDLPPVDKHVWQNAQRTVYFVTFANELLHVFIYYMQPVYNQYLTFTQQRAEGLESALTFHVSDFM